MTVTVDCRHIDSSGIGVYLRETLPFLLNSANNFFLLGDGNKLEPFRQKSSGTTIIDCTIKPFSLRELFFFPKSILRLINACDLFYSPYFNIPGGIKIPVYITIHDIIFPDMPELVSKIGLSARMFFYRRAYKKSKKIFTVSKFSKSRIEHHLGTAKPVIVTYSAIQDMFTAYRANIRKTEKKKTILFIGNVKKHKGLYCLLDAFLSAREEGLPHTLIIIGAKDNFRTSDNEILQKIESIGGDTVSFTGIVSNEQLVEYLSEASLLVQPSLYEGFGLPPLEAMVLGTPALISDIPVFREIYSDFPVTFFSAGNCADLKEKMLNLLLVQNPAALSLPGYLAEKYTFQKTSSVILQNLT